MVVIDQVKNIEMMSLSDKMSLLPSNVNCWVKSKNSSKKQNDLKMMTKIFLPPRILEIDRLDRKNDNWNHVRTFELLFDNELIDFIVQMKNAYAIEINAVGWVPIDRSDICCFLRILMLSYHHTKCFGQRPLLCSNN